tara:strand:- start:1653 stop:1766 length:114 start_codon:yes stop_codon:yes gene_type:complete
MGKKKGMSDQGTEALTGVVLVLVIVAGIVFWMTGHPY